MHHRCCDRRRHHHLRHHHPHYRLHLQVFTEGAVREMAKHVDEPVIFPLSNPTSHCECSAEEAAMWTDGKAIFASGSPFDSVTLPNGVKMRTNQCNNAYCFPGMGLGILTSRATRVTDTMFQARFSLFKCRSAFCPTDALPRLLLAASLNLSPRSSWTTAFFSRVLLTFVRCHSKWR